MIARRHITRFWLWAVVAGLVGALCGCHRIIELDPDWVKRQIAKVTERGFQGDAGASRDANPQSLSQRDEHGASDGGADTDPVSASPHAVAPKDKDCTRLSLLSFKIYGQRMFPRSGQVLMIGNVGDEFAKTWVYTSPPPGWRTSPREVRADERGRFAFLLDRHKSEAKIDSFPIYSPNKWCYLYKPKALDQVDKRKELLELPRRESCHRGKEQTFHFPLDDEFRSSISAYSSRPDLFEVLSSKVTSDQGKKRDGFEVTVRCKGEGQAFLLMGHSSILPRSLPIKVR